MNTVNDNQYLSFLEYLPVKALQRIDVDKARCGDPVTCPLAQAFNASVISGLDAISNLVNMLEENPLLGSDPFKFLILATPAQEFMGWWDGKYVGTLVQDRRRILKVEINRLIEEKTRATA